jgi:hypothetical protein
MEFNRQINVAHLKEDEIEYELIVRSVPIAVGESLESKQRLLRGILRSDNGSEEIFKDAFEDEEILDSERKAIKERVSEIFARLKTDGTKAEHFGSFHSRLNHYFIRVKRIIFAVKSDKEKVELERILSSIEAVLIKYFSMQVDKSGGAMKKNKIGKSLQQPKDKSNLLDNIEELTSTLNGLEQEKRRIENRTPEGAEGGEDKGSEDSEKLKHIIDQSITKIEAKKGELIEQLINMTRKDEKEMNRRYTKPKHTPLASSSVLGYSSSQESSSSEEEMSEDSSDSPSWHASSSEESSSSSQESIVRKSKSKHKSSRKSGHSKRSKKSKKKKSKSRRSDSDNDQRTPISRWPIKFSGEDDFTVSDFLRHLRVTRKREKLSKEVLLRKIGCLLKGKAQEWYLSACRRFKKWHHFETGLKEAFTPADNDYFVMLQCENRKQAKNETFEIYLARMNRLFESLSYRLSEQMKLSILKQNIKPAHKVGVAMLDIHTVDELRQYCRRLDSLDHSLYATPAQTAQTRISNHPHVFEIEESGNTRRRRNGSRNKSPQHERVEVNEVDRNFDRNSTQGQQPRFQRNPDPQQQNGRNEIGRSENQGFQRRQSFQPNRSTYTRQNLNSETRLRSEAPNGLRPVARDQTYGASGQSQAQTLTRLYGSTNPFLDDWSEAVTGQSGNVSQRPSQEMTLGQQGPPVPSRMQVAERGQRNPQVQRRSNSNPPGCWNCSAQDHFYQDCPMPRRIYCQGCGREGIYTGLCPLCEGNLPRRLNLGARQPL